jgi:hypothetical protein
VDTIVIDSASIQCISDIRVSECVLILIHYEDFIPVVLERCGCLIWINARSLILTYEVCNRQIVWLLCESYLVFLNKWRVFEWIILLLIVCYDFYISYWAITVSQQRKTLIWVVSLISYTNLILYIYTLTVTYNKAIWTFSSLNIRLHQP